ncbi:MAG: phospholipase D-like domain-containing protein [Akkermansia sp.]
MYHKRLRAYRKIAYEIYDDSTTESPKHNVIYQHDNYHKDYEDDLATAKHSIVILSPFMSPAKAKAFVNVSRQALARGVQTSMITTTPSELPSKLIASASDAIRYLQALGIHVNMQQRLHINAAIIDEDIVWYSSMNLMAKDKTDAHLMRLYNKNLAHEILEMHLKE